MCFADAGHWGYNNCMGSCMSKGEGCEKCMVLHLLYGQDRATVQRSFGRMHEDSAGILSCELYIGRSKASADRRFCLRGQELPSLCSSAVDRWCGGDSQRSAKPSASYSRPSPALQATGVGLEAPQEPPQKVATPSASPGDAPEQGCPSPSSMPV
eukprot:g17054.t1